MLTILYAAPRQAVIDHSRATYSRPRAEVEREVERQLGHHRPEEALKAKTNDASKPGTAQIHQPESAPTETTEVKNLLIEVGLLPEQVEALLERHDLLSIRRQLAWLPYRGAKNPAGFLMAAVKDNYEAPPTLRPSPDTDLPLRTQATDTSNNLEVNLEIPEAHDGTDELPPQM